MSSVGSFGSYVQFKQEFLRQRAGPLTSSVEDIADDIYTSQASEELETLWDSVDDDE
jgi:hypothetical protein